MKKLKIMSSNQMENWYVILLSSLKEVQSNAAAYPKFEKLIYTTIEKGYDLDFVPLSSITAGNTILYCAIIDQCPKETILLLIELGASLSCHNRFGDDALSLAIAYQASEEVLREIVTKSDVNSTDRLGRTAIGKWCEIYIMYGQRWGSGRDRGDLTELKFLLQSGADPDKDTYWKRKKYTESPQLKRLQELIKFIETYQELSQELQNNKINQKNYEYDL